MEQKTFIEASCMYNTHWRKNFLQLLLLKVCELFRFGQIKTREVYFWSVRVFFHFYKEDKTK